MNARTLFLVTRPGDTAPFWCYPSREFAEAVCTAKKFEYPNIGPWEVVELREVVEQAEALPA